MTRGFERQSLKGKKGFEGKETRFRSPGAAEQRCRGPHVQGDADARAAKPSVKISSIFGEVSGLFVPGLDVADLLGGSGHHVLFCLPRSYSRGLGISTLQR